MLGIIKRNSIYLTEDAFVKSLVWCHLENAKSVWNFYRQGLIKELEKVQMRATKLSLSKIYLIWQSHSFKFTYITL